MAIVISIIAIIYFLINGLEASNHICMFTKFKGTLKESVF